ncbi:MAG: serine/threonine-protein kinase, partial [Verrucomicrobiota bacterium]
MPEKDTPACPSCGVPLPFKAEGVECTACLLKKGAGILLGQGLEEAPEPAEVPMEERPDSTGDYEILETLGRGGMGVVYRARHRKLGREVALKMTSGERPSIVKIARFKVEAEAAARLEHPNLLPVYDFGEEDGIPFYTMRLIAEARIISDVREVMGPRELAEILARVADGVDHAHRQGVLHRDLKPGNILLDDENTPYVCDFGLAKLIGDSREDAVTLTLESEVLGSPSYMAPEQDGEGQVTTATDVYGLGT